MKNKIYQMCNRCVLDTTVPDIMFDEKGICNYCKEAEEYAKTNWYPNEDGRAILENLINEIKQNGRGKKYDCILGLSGGVDSSYLAHLASKEWGLRVLAVHVNAGWNSEIAEANIEKIVKQNNIDLFTYVVDWQEVRDLQLSYLKSGVVNQDIPQDHIFFTQLYSLTTREKIKYVITGINYATECILPPSWGYDALDSLNLHSIHKKYGSIPLRSYKTISFFKRFVYYPFIMRQVNLKPLNLMIYDKEKAKEFLKKEYDWVDYGMKHGESVFTKFYQNYWLPSRNGFDKRKAHYSSMIMSGYITREIALKKLKEPLYDSIELQRDKEYIAHKLEITVEELEKFFHAPIRSHYEFPNYSKYTNLLVKIRKFITNK